MASPGVKLRALRASRRREEAAAAAALIASGRLSSSSSRSEDEEAHDGARIVPEASVPVLPGVFAEDGSGPPLTFLETLQAEAGDAWPGLPPEGFLYLSAVDGHRYRLRLVHPGEINPDDYYTLSATAVTHYVEGESEFTSLEAFEREYRLYRLVTGLSFFTKYTSWKAFTSWRRGLRTRKINRCKRALEENLFLVQPTLRTTLIQLRSMCHDVSTSQLYSTDDTETYTLSRFCMQQETTKNAVGRTLREFVDSVRTLVHRTCVLALQSFLDDSGFIDKLDGETALLPGSSASRARSRPRTAAVMLADAAADPSAALLAATAVAADGSAAAAGGAGSAAAGRAGRAALGSRGGGRAAASSSTMSGVGALVGMSARRGAKEARDITFTERAAMRTQCRRLTKYVRLADFLVIDAFLALALDSTAAFLRYVSPPSRAAAGAGAAGAAGAGGDGEGAGGEASGDSSADVLGALEESKEDATSALTSATAALLSTTGLSKRGELTPRFEVEVTLQDGSDELLFEPAPADFKTKVEALIYDGLKVVTSPQRLLTHEDFRAFTDPAIDESGPVGSGLNLEDMIHADATFRGMVGDITACLQDAFDRALRYAAVFAPFRERYLSNLSFQRGLTLEAWSHVPLETFEDSINHYKAEHEEFEGIPVASNVGIVRVDSTALKALFLPSPSACLDGLFQLLPAIAKRKNAALLEEMQHANSIISSVPYSVDEFVELMSFLRQTNESMPQLERRYNFINAMYRVMERQGIKVDEEDKTNNFLLTQTQSSLAMSIQLSEESVEDNTVRFSKKLDDAIPRLRDQVAEAKQLLAHSILSDPDADMDAAIAYLEDVETRVARLKEQAERYRRYQEILNVPIASYEDLDDVVVELQLKKKLWVSLESWQRVSAEWRAAEFASINADVLARDVAYYLKVVKQTERGLADNAVVPLLRDTVLELHRTVPVVGNLRCPALHDRHWDRIHALLGFELHEQPGFTLGALLGLRAMDHAEEIETVAVEAVQERALEELLAKVTKLWESTEFPLLPHGKDTWILGDLEELVADLEDSQVTVSTILGSRFVGAIRGVVDDWQRKLALMAATLEEWQLCQKKWMYLQTIFTAPDLQRQLPTEAKSFAHIDKAWRDIMRRTYDASTALRMGTAPGLRESLAKYNAQLDKIEKSLEDYLETKRQAFPRFYFLVNDELLDILAQTGNPLAVQPHLRKCFDNIKELEFGDDPTTPDVLAMRSGEGERVPLGRNLKVRGYVEEWLLAVQGSMQTTLHKLMKAGLADYASRPRAEWVTAHPGQVVATVAQIMWCRQTEACLRADRPSEELEKWYNLNVQQLRALTVLVRGELPPLARRVIVALVTTDVHARDIVELLKQERVTSTNAFTWQRQLRYAWQRDVDDCVVRQASCTVRYGYEYMGATSRLVITPLTDRCWMTITGALALKLGANPAGPAGTGKTESSKDLAKALGIQCIVFNCSDQINYRTTGKLFRGLAQAGCWTCLDEFNRIDIEVLSVIAQQLSVLRRGKLAGAETVMFEEREIGLRDHHVIVTMNPGYAGRTELPDNLKVFFRPVAMMIPDYGLIAEIMLYAEGFASAKTLSRKMVKLYKLCSEQLSQQPHYDFGMRAVKSVLVMAGALKRADTALSEDVVLIRAMRDSNLPKFLPEDLPLFHGIVGDLFPGVDVPYNDHGELQLAIEAAFCARGLQPVPALVAKVMQLWEIFGVRFGAALVGPTGGGKTATYRALADALSLLAAAEGAARAVLSGELPPPPLPTASTLMAAAKGAPAGVASAIASAAAATGLLPSADGGESKRGGGAADGSGGDDDGAAPPDGSGMRGEEDPFAMPTRLPDITTPAAAAAANAAAAAAAKLSSFCRMPGDVSARARVRAMHAAVALVTRMTAEAGSEEALLARAATYQPVVADVMNPKAVDILELFGDFNELTQEWHDGLASSMMRAAAASEEASSSWTVFDGPIDAQWIENMNTVLDDNQMLCLSNGQRIKLNGSRMRMLFEVGDLAQASPATVSRLGVVFIVPEDLGWRPLVHSWLARSLPAGCPVKLVREALLADFEHFLPRMLRFLRKEASLPEPIATVDVQAASALCQLFTALYSEQAGVDFNMPADAALRLVHMLFIYCLIWSLGVSADPEDRAEFGITLRDLIPSMEGDVRFPVYDEVFDFYVDYDDVDWRPWSERVPDFVFDSQQSYFDMMVPTLDSVRYSSVIGALIMRGAVSALPAALARRPSDAAAAVDFDDSDPFAAADGAAAAAAAAAAAGGDVMTSTRRASVASVAEAVDMLEASVTSLSASVAGGDGGAGGGGRSAGALSAVNGVPVFLTGVTGTGKTALLRHLLGQLAESEDEAAAGAAAATLSGAGSSALLAAAGLDGGAGEAGASASSAAILLRRASLSSRDGGARGGRDAGSSGAALASGSLASLGGGGSATLPPPVAAGGNRHQRRLAVQPLFINFSARTSSAVTQSMLENGLEKKRRALLGAPAGRRVVAFVDDVNLPAPEKYGAQPPIELLRQVLDCSGFFDRSQLFWKDIRDTTMLAAAAPPGGGRHALPQRFTRHFSVICLPAADEAALQHMFGSILSGFLAPFPADVREMAGAVTLSTVQVFTRLAEELLPTPAKSHYTFNLRDVSKVFQGMLQTSRKQCSASAQLARLWLHESMRVFHDRLVDDSDRAWFTELLHEMLARNFRLPWRHAELFEGEPIIFGDWLRPHAEERVYEEAGSLAKVERLLDNFQDEFNSEGGADRMSLVFFPDAIEHIARLARILRQPRGNAMLVGVGGSGRQSVTRLAAFIVEYDCSTIELTRGYGPAEFREDLKALFQRAGVGGVPSVFLLTDTQMVNEAFLEDVSSLLNAGEVPNLWAPDELDRLVTDMRPIARELGAVESDSGCYQLFVERCRTNLHVVLCMSPVGSALRVRTRQFPSLINCCTIDWYSQWPHSALRSVAQRFLNELTLPSDDVRDALVELCVEVHTSVSSAAARFLQERRRHVYTTPKSYLDLIDAYARLLGGKRRELEGDRDRLAGGVQKLEDTNNKVAGLEVDLKTMQPVLREKTRVTEDLLKRVAVDQAEAEKIREKVEVDEKDVKARAEEVAELQADAQRELDKAMPALMDAMQELDHLERRHITEMKAYITPPEAVMKVMQAVCLLLRAPTDWDSARKLLGDLNFMTRLLEFDKDNIAPSLLKKLRSTYLRDPLMQVATVERVSVAATTLCKWVHAVDMYAAVHQEVEPLRLRLEEMNKVLEEANAILESKQAELKEVTDRVMLLQKECDETMAEKNRLLAESELTKLRLERASKLTLGLADEHVRWRATVERLAGDLHTVVGDSFLAAASLSYCGPFSGDYRQALEASWLEAMELAAVPVSPGYSLVTALGDPVLVQDWQINGLPTDSVSTTNAILATRGERWPLAIDPQGQANRWIKAMESKAGLTVVKASAPGNLLRTLESCVRIGRPLLLEDVSESLDPALQPLLEREIFRVGGRTLLRLGDADIDYDPRFRFYMTTKNPNPHYLPETAIRVSLINFTVTLDGLEEQLLGELVAREAPAIEKKKNMLVISQAEDRKALKDIEDKILSNLQESTGLILDDEELINTLSEAKRTSAIINDRVKESEKTEVEVNDMRDQYRPVATLGSLLYFVVADLVVIDPMYQYSLEYFTRLFNLCVESSPKSDVLATRLSTLLQTLTHTIFSNVCRGLFEKHKLLFSFLICAAIQRQEGVITEAEWELLLRGPAAMVVDSGAAERGGAPPPASDASIVGLTLARRAGGDSRSGSRSGAAADASGSMSGRRRSSVGAPVTPPPNPVPAMLSEGQWAFLCTLEAHVPATAGLPAAIAGSAVEWDAWLHGADLTTLPEGTPELSPFQHLLLLRCLRDDALLPVLRDYVARHLGRKFVASTTASMEEVYADMDSATPCIFVLSQGADPTGVLLRFAEDAGMAKKLLTISLGQGQGPRAAALIHEACKSGKWVLLQNCHLARSWMPALEKIVNDLQDRSGRVVHSDFRLFLTSFPAPYFPAAVLQNGVKLTTEPPRGVRNNVRRSYELLLEEEEWESCPLPRAWKKLAFGVSFFHALVQERRKFGPLGWNIQYGFNDSDLEASLSVLRDLLSTAAGEVAESKEGEAAGAADMLPAALVSAVPWDALLYTTGEINYGGRVTDEWDRRCLLSILNRFYTPDVLRDGYAVCGDARYTVPAAGAFEEHTAFIDSLPSDDRPELFGMHDNASISYQRQEVARLLGTILSIQPAVGTAAGGAGKDGVVLELARGILSSLPQPLSKAGAAASTFVRDDKGIMDSLSTVLSQEMVKFNRLLAVMRDSLNDLKRAIRGLVVMSDSLERMYQSFVNGTVPELWEEAAYPSLRPLGAWVKDMLSRVRFLRGWLTSGRPHAYPIASFFFPQGFLTGALQNHARKYQTPINLLEYRFTVLPPTEPDDLLPPEDGVIVYGMQLEGARWDEHAGQLAEALPRQSYAPMPPVHLLPHRDARSKGAVYRCPVYKTSVRAGQLSTTGLSTNFVIAMSLPIDDSRSADFWVLQGVALLLEAFE